MLSFLCAQVSAAIMAQPQGQFGYQIVRIIKTTSLGVGSYGAVYRALCNELPCTAKILHPTLFETNDPGARKIMERFELECQFLSGVRHPNIVQYLGLSRDPESGLLVLLMELKVTENDCEKNLCFVWIGLALCAYVHCLQQFQYSGPGITESYVAMPLYLGNKMCVKLHA